MLYCAGSSFVPCARVIAAGGRCVRSFNDESVEAYLKAHMPEMADHEREYASFVEGLFTR